MLPFEPWMALQSNTMTLPGLPVALTMPCFSTNEVKQAFEGTPYSCFFSDA